MQGASLRQFCCFRAVQPRDSFIFQVKRARERLKVSLANVNSQFTLTSAICLGIKTQRDFK